MTISQLSLGLVADVVVVLALAVNFVYMVRVARRLKTLRSGSSEMKSLLEDFSRHVDRSQQALGDLRAVADGAGANLRADIEAAERMHQDLIFALKACEGISTRMEALRNDGRERLATLSEAAERERPRAEAPQARAPARDVRPAPRAVAASPVRTQDARQTPKRTPVAAVSPAHAEAAPKPVFDPAPAQADALTTAVRPAQWRQMPAAAAVESDGFDATIATAPQPLAAPGGRTDAAEEPQRGAALKQFLMSMRNKETG